MNNFFIRADLLIDRNLLVELFQQVSKLLIVNRLSNVIAIMIDEPLILFTSWRTLQYHA